MRSINQPESWWGWHGYNHPQALSIVQIMQAGTLPPRLAALFWLGLEHRASFVFAADPPGAGKTALLTALLAFAPPQTNAYFTRGWGETFDLPPPSDDHATYIMVNEMSDHLPVYSWGPYVVRAFELLGKGYSLCTTMHADDAQGVIDQLVDDNGVPREHAGRLTFIVPLFIGQRDGRPLRRVLDVAAPRWAGGTLSLCSVARWEERTDTFAVVDTPEAREAVAAKLGLAADGVEPALARREAFLQKLLDEEVTAITAVQEAVDHYRRAAGTSAP